jgi:hypothetical protein
VEKKERADSQIDRSLVPLRSLSVRLPCYLSVHMPQGTERAVPCVWIYPPLSLLGSKALGAAPISGWLGRPSRY